MAPSLKCHRLAFNFCCQWQRQRGFASFQGKFPQGSITHLAGYRINTVKVGHGPHAVFLLPGIMGCMELQLSPQLLGFDPNLFTIYSWDQPGYAGSQPPTRAFTVDSLSEDSQLLVSLLKTFGHKSYSLLGWSGGGMTALVTAINHPGLISKLVVWGAWARTRQEDAERFTWFRDTRNLGGKMKDALVQYYGQDYFEQEWDRWMQVFISIYTDHGGEFCARRLNQIKCPTLIIHGAQDGLIPPDHAQFLHQNIKDSKLLIWEKGKHNVHLRYPLEFNNCVQHFLTE